MRSTVLAFGTAISAVAAAVLLRWLLDPMLGDTLPLVTLYGAVAVAVWAGGYRPGVLAAVTGFLACDFLFMQPRGAFGFEDSRVLVGAAAFLMTCGIIIAFGELMRSAQRRAREEHEQLQTTLASIGDAVIATDKDGRITTINAVAESLTGWKKCDALGQPLDTVFNIVNEQTRKPVTNPAMRALSEGVVVGLANHTVLIGKDGNERPIDDSAAPIRDGQGQIIGCVLVFRDITDRRRVEGELAKRLADARFLAAIVESSTDAILSKSLDGVIHTWNAAAQRMFGYTAEQAIGRHISFLIPADRADEEERNTKRIRAGEAVEHFETVRRRSDGETVHVSLTLSPIRDEQGRVIGASKIVRDITDRKHTEERVYGLLSELKRADRRKDEFLATLAHELRNPLAPIRNTLEILKRAQGQVEAFEDICGMMERQVNHLSRLVDDLLDVSRIVRDRMELRKEQVELNSIVHQSIEACGTLAERGGLQLTVNIAPQPIYLHADPVRLSQVFGNLLNNACKYTDPGGKVVLAIEREGSDVVVKVTDTGVGIPTDKLSSVFEMFAQIDRTLERSQGGLGIGLMLVKRLVEMHGGTVTAHSEGPGMGSEFVVRLPILVSPPGPVAPSPAELSPAPPRRVLVVDDNEDSASSLAKLLRMTGNETRIAHDGLAAVTSAEEFRPDVVLLDIGLPLLNGYDACQRIRQQSWGKDIVMVALTGWGQEDDRRRSKAVGFDHHLVKPLDYAALMMVLSSKTSEPVG
jgi:PAS domain S-box-containing protein